MIKSVFFVLLRVFLSNEENCQKQKSIFKSWRRLLNIVPAEIADNALIDCLYIGMRDYIYSPQGRVVQKAISANPGLKFNRLFILVCSVDNLS